MRRAIQCLALLLAMCSCSTGQKADNAAYMVSIEPQRRILEALVDSGTAISTMLDRGADPETFEPTMAKRMEAEAVEMYFATGVLPFESKIAESVKGKYVDTSTGFTPIYGTHSHSARHDHDEESAPDPHYWTSISGVRTMAENMAAELSRLHPEQKESIRQRLISLEARLDSIDTSLKERFAAAGTIAFAIWHPSLSYLARDYGLRQITIGQESKEMSARQVRAAIDTARADSVAVFFIQREYDTRQAKTINAEIGSRMVVINPLSYNWEDEINLIADELLRP